MKVPRVLRSLSARLLLFNVLILFLPLGSILFLDTYENQLLSSQENSMIQQGRILSSALAGTDLGRESRRVLENLGARVDSRIRVVDAAGRLLADSATISGIPTDPAAAEVYGPYGPGAGDAESAKSHPLYRIAVYPVNLVKRFLFPPAVSFSGGEYYSGQQVLLGPEVRAALEGRYGAATRLSSGGQVSVNLYSAIPVPGGAEGEIAGAVLVSRSSYGVLLNLYRIRLDIIKIFFLSLGVSLVLSLALSLTITAPVKRLKREAEQMLDKSGRFRGRFRALKRRDEIGDLSRSLEALSGKLEQRIPYIENFTSDLLHELKNPLAAIRGQAELALASNVKEDKLIRGIGEEEARIERLLARLRELGRIDNALEQESPEPVDLRRFLSLIPERYPRRNGEAPPVVFLDRSGTDGGAWVQANPGRLTQALTNPLDNARSFSPPGETLTLTLDRGTGKTWRITINDHGPGIREETGDRYFDRFYSERPGDERENHSGLGLAIARGIIAGYGGSCGLENLRDQEGRVTGCRFFAVLPGV